MDTVCAVVSLDLLLSSVFALSSPFFIFIFTPLQQASALSRELGIPRVYIAANSGARIGLAEELKQLFKVAWIDETSPNKGFKYLYLSPSDYMKVGGCGMSVMYK